MNNITIVTAFFDIGRSEWTTDKGFPHYLKRTTDTYFERFEHLAKLENKIIVYTSEEFVGRIKQIRGDKPTEVISLDLQKTFDNLRQKIVDVQTNPEYISKINPSLIKNPEYWNADYVLINLLKSAFVRKSIQDELIETDMAAWIDFGYCRTKDTLNGITEWNVNLDPEKIHMFNIRDWSEGTYIQDVIANNVVYITGPAIIASKKNWPTLEALILHSLNELLKNNLIDDDQTLLLMSFLSAPQIFQLHRVDENDWFVVFRNYSS